MECLLPVNFRGWQIPELLPFHPECDTRSPHYFQWNSELLLHTAKYNLSKEDGFLDWLFGWGTGYQMIWKKLKSYAGSEDNEIKLVENKFKEDVLNYESILR